MTADASINVSYLLDGTFESIRQVRRPIHACVATAANELLDAVAFRNDRAGGERLL